MSRTVRGGLAWRTWLQVRGDWWLQTVAVSSLTAALVVWGLFLAVGINAQRALERVGTGGAVMLILADDATPDLARDLLVRLSRQPAVQSARFVTAQEALSRFRAQLGEHAQLLEGLRDNPLPPSIEVLLPPGPLPQELRDEWSRWPSVVEVVTSRPWLRSLENLRAPLARLGSTLLALLVVGMVFLVINTVRLAVHARRRHLEILALVGAGVWFVRGPFLLEALFQGLASAVLASGLVGVILWVLASPASLPLGVDMVMLFDFPAPLPLYILAVSWSAALAGGLLGTWRASSPRSGGDR